MTESATSPFRHEASGRPTPVVFDPVTSVATGRPEAAGRISRAA
jgi:hypothetical protein